LALTAIGASELYLALVAWRRQGSRIELSAHLLLAAGGLLMGYALLGGLRTIPFIVGSALFGAGIIVTTRRMLAMSASK
jgi:hypothetical protein